MFREHMNIVCFLYQKEWIFSKGIVWRMEFELEVLEELVPEIIILGLVILVVQKAFLQFWLTLIHLKLKESNHHLFL
ncbi:hypothetical protein BK355_12680 [Escherichia coli]|nr:hypothetical protein BK355_12680 [Escherichia coli]